MKNAEELTDEDFLPPPPPAGAAAPVQQMDKDQIFLPETAANIFSYSMVQS